MGERGGKSAGGRKVVVASSSGLACWLFSGELGEPVTGKVEAVIPGKPEQLATNINPNRVERMRRMALMRLLCGFVGPILFLYGAHRP